MHEQKKRLKLLLKICQRLGRSTGDRQLRILSSEQLGYVSHRLSVPCHVEACPGSGKTEIVGIKAAYEFLGWQDRFSGIAILTFTKNAAAEIKSRVVHYAGARSTIHPHFVGTIDSWLHSYLFQPFSHAVTGYLGALDGDRSTRIIESDTVPAFLNNYIVTANGGGAVFANQYHQRLDGRLEGETSLARFDQQQLERTKRRFLKDGFATYQDAETLCYRVLRECQIIAKLLARRFTHIIVDECQDLSDTQLYVFYELLKAGAVFHFVGDLNQAIYEFRSVNPSNVASFVKKQGFVRRSLTQNHRSNQPIVDVCSRLIGIGGIQASRPVASETPCILWQYTDHTFGSLPRFFHKVITSAGLSDQNSCIVARGRSLIKQLSPQTEAHIGPVQLFEVALSCWKLANRSAHHMQRALDYAGKSLSVLAYGGRGHHSKQYCPEKVDSKKWRIFLADVLNSATMLDPSALSWSDWAKKLRTYLSGIWPSLPVKGRDWVKARNSIVAPKGQATISIGAPPQVIPDEPNIRITTIHDVKGETLDALLLISSKSLQSPGGHFQHWLHPEDGKEEYRRFAYVACSRPRHLLVIATPQLSEKSLKELVELGLEPQDLPLL